MSTVRRLPVPFAKHHRSKRLELHFRFEQSRYVSSLAHLRQAFPIPPLHKNSLLSRAILFSDQNLFTRQFTVEPTVRRTAVCGRFITRIVSGSRNGNSSGTTARLS